MLAGHFLNLFRLPRSYLSSHQLCSRSLPNLFKAYSSTHCFWMSLSDQPHLWENHCVNSRNHSLELDESVWVSWCHQSILETLIKFSLAADWIRLVRSTIIIDNRIDIGLEGTWNIESNLNQWQTTWWDRKVYGNQTQKRRIASDNMSCQEEEEKEEAHERRSEWMPDCRWLFLGNMDNVTPIERCRFKSPHITITQQQIPSKRSTFKKRAYRRHNPSTNARSAVSTSCCEAPIEEPWPHCVTMSEMRCPTRTWNVCLKHIWNHIFHCWV